MARALQPGSSTKTTVSHTYPLVHRSRRLSLGGGDPGLLSRDRAAPAAEPRRHVPGPHLRRDRPGNRSPVSSMPPVVNVKQGGIQRFRVPAIDRDPDTHLQFRVGRGAEAGYPLFFFIPGLTIDPDTGEVTWDTSGLTPGFYAEQFVIEDYSASTGEFRTSVAVDPQSAPVRLHAGAAELRPADARGRDLVRRGERSAALLHRAGEQPRAATSRSTSRESPRAPR